MNQVIYSPLKPFILSVGSLLPESKAGRTGPFDFAALRSGRTGKLKGILK